MSRRAGFLLVLVLMGTLAVYFGGRGGLDPERRVAAGVEPVAPPQDLVAAATASPGVERHSFIEPEEKILSLQGRVVSGEKTPIPDARVRWVCLRREDVELDPAWNDDSWVPLVRQQCEAHADTNGRFLFRNPPAPVMPFGSALVVTHDGFVVEGRFLPSEQVERLDPIEIVLQPGAPVEVRVVDFSGMPVSGARVEHHGLAQESQVRGDPKAVVQMLFFGEAVTAKDGRASLDRFPGEQMLRASKAGHLSVPWRGLDPRSVELVLGDAFYLEGTATMPEWDPGYVGERRLLISAREGHVWKLVGQVRGVPDGAFGPLPIPLGKASRFRIRLEGSPIIPIEREFAPPPAGETVRFDLIAERGEALWFGVYDEEGRPVPDSIGEAFWPDREDPGVLRWVRMGGKPDGRLSLWSFPAGSVTYRITAPGFASYESTAEVPTDYGYDIVLERGGALEGRCLHAGEPISDFVVSLWRQGPAPYPTHHTFVGRPNGGFRIDSLAAGDWFVTACSSDYPSSAAQPITITAREAARMEIELPLALVGRGRVVSAAQDSKGDPLPEAFVQPYSAGTMRRTAPWGPERPVQADGRFEIAAFVTGTNYMNVRAPGFAPRDVEAVARPGEELDWGDIALYPTQRLSVSLVGLTEGAASYRGSALGASPLPVRSFASDGTIQYEEAAPGQCQFFIERSSSDWLRMTLQLEPGADWNYECPVGGGASLRVRIVTPSGKPLGFVPGIIVHHQDAAGVWMMRYHTAPDLEAVFSGLRSHDAKVSVFDPAGQPIATKQALLVEGEETLVELHLDEDPLRLRVVDPDGVPVDSAWVIARTTTGTIFGSDDTDAEGWAELQGVPEHAVLIDVSHRILGRRIGVVVEASSREAEVVLEAESAVELRVLDGGEPLAEVAVALEVAPGLPLGEPARTDADGRARFEPLGPGTYRYALRRHDCWPAIFECDLGADEERRAEVQVRRLADLELRLVGPDGALLTGVAVELTSCEFAVEVGDWIQEGAVAAPGGLASDRQGVVRIQGLPRGEYSWKVALPDGSSAAGVLTLLPGTTNDETVSLTGR